MTGVSNYDTPPVCPVANVIPRLRVSDPTQPQLVPIILTALRWWRWSEGRVATGGSTGAKIEFQKIEKLNFPAWGGTRVLADFDPKRPQKLNSISAKIEFPSVGWYDRKSNFGQN